jgi:hypothetical protein
LRRLLSSICVQNQYRATPATFRTQIEQYCRKSRKNQTANQKKALNVRIVSGRK